MSCVLSLGGCSGLFNRIEPALTGLPDSVFEAEPEYSGSMETVGQLAEGYLTNTTSLRKANNKLSTLCVAANRCEQADSDE